MQMYTVDDSNRLSSFFNFLGIMAGILITGNVVSKFQRRQYYGKNDRSANDDSYPYTGD